MAEPNDPPLARPVTFAQPGLSADLLVEDASPRGFEPLTLLSRRDATLDLVLILMMAIVLQYGPQIVAVLTLFPDGARTFRPELLILSKYSELCLALTLLGYLAWRHRLPAADLGFGHTKSSILPSPYLRPVGWALVAVVGCYAVFLPLALISFGIGSFFVDPGREIDRRIDFVSAMPSEDIRLLIVLMTAVAAQEEIIFRGLLLPYVRRLCGSWTVAVGLTSLIFAVLHVPGQGVLSALPIFGIGCMLGAVFVWSRSLPAVILAHFVFNVVQVLIARVLLGDLLKSAAEAAEKVAQ